MSKQAHRGYVIHLEMELVLRTLESLTQMSPNQVPQSVHATSAGLFS